MEGRSGIPRFQRRFLDPAEPVTAIGGGPPGGKARGLIRIRDVLAARAASGDAFRADVPALTVIGTDVFDQFVEQNGLRPLVDAEPSDTRLALACQAAHLPVEILGDLRAIASDARMPLAVRSSSLLEDALEHPFAGVYATKMLANDQQDTDGRFRRLTEAIKLVYASTFFGAARQYIAAAGRTVADEKMAVVVQEVVGSRHGARFYPEVSGVARSYSFYRSGSARPEDGFAALAVGLGKTIVDGGIAWQYTPARPRAMAPFASASALLDCTQRTFWAVSLGAMPRYDPTSEVEFLVRGSLEDAEADGALRYTASSYDAGSDRLYSGVRGAGARALTFAPLLVDEALPLNQVIRDMLSASEAALGAPAEIEFACTLPAAGDRATRPRFGLVQVRPMAVWRDPVTITAAEWDDRRRLLASTAALGNGRTSDVADVVYVRRDTFDAAHAAAIAGEIAQLNLPLVAERRPYVLIGFGRWGSSDPWLGIPVDWSSIAGARVVVETTLPSRRVDPSQGSHFFHNISSFGVLYFTVRPGVDPPIAWEWLEAQPVAHATPHVVHVRLRHALRIAVDGRVGHGVIRRADPEEAA
jgi:pyruvate phosphate dikinase-like enzyme